MQFSEFREQTLAAVPGGEETERRALRGRERDDFYAFGFVSAVLAPAYLAALGGDGDLELLAGVLERGLAQGDDEVVNALAMRIVERHLCRDEALLAAALAVGGPATRLVAGKITALIDEADARAAAERLARCG